jgi:hypothetical protein
MGGMSQPIAAPTIAGLFQTLTEDDIRRFVDERRQEDLTLDFKLMPALLNKRDDRKILAIAVSGFANSAGGLIVWGVDARKGESDDGRCPGEC